MGQLRAAEINLKYHCNEYVLQLGIYIYIARHIWKGNVDNKHIMSYSFIDNININILHISIIAHMLRIIP